MTYDQSAVCYEKAACIPGRSLTRSKAPGRLYPIGSGPLYASHGDGALLYDVDGNEFIDMVCALGAISLGYGCHWNSDQRWLLSLPSYLEGVAADAVLSALAPWASSVRFVKTGSEATHAAYRITKTATKRSCVLIGDWCYFGWHEWCATPAWAGVVKYPHGFDFDQVVNPDEIAAVFIEPHRWEPTREKWLQSARMYCDRIGALLVFDEMIYGLRASMGGSVEYFGVQPDIACFGKALGNGAPIACVVGNEAVQRHGELISGTYSGDAVSLAATLDVLDTYKREPVIQTLWARGQQLKAGLLAAIHVTGWNDEAFVEGVIPPHQRLRFADATVGKRFAAEMAARSILWHPDLANTMCAHTEEQISRVVEAAAESLKALR